MRSPTCRLLHCIMTRRCWGRRWHVFSFPSASLLILKVLSMFLMTADTPCDTCCVTCLAVFHICKHGCSFLCIYTAEDFQYYWLLLLTSSTCLKFIKLRFVGSPCASFRGAALHVIIGKRMCLHFSLWLDEKPESLNQTVSENVLNLSLGYWQTFGCLF